MKKLLSTILAVLMPISAVSVSAAAINTSYEIKLDQTVTVTVTCDEPIYVSFVPEKDGTYILSAESDDLDTYCTLWDENCEDVLEMADDDNGLDFVIEYEFEAGTTYYFELNIFNEGTFEYKITLECGHGEYSDGICTVCSVPCDHTVMDFLGFCTCGKEYIAKDIKAGDEFIHDSAVFDNEIGWYKFVPEESGAYCFESFRNPTGPNDSICYVYDADGEHLISHDDVDYDNGNLNFNLIYGFEAGVTYYIGVYDIYKDASFEVNVSRATHTADDGSVHKLDFYYSQDSTCIEHGYTDGIYCLECDEYLDGHEEFALLDYHTDEDEDGICDYCESELECSHMCHSDNWFLQIIWKISNFFNRLFGSNPYCRCEMPHY